MLIKVINKETGESTSLALDVAMTLKEVREKLVQHNLMSEEIGFIFNGSKIIADDEAEIKVSELIGIATEITIGKTGDIDQTFKVSDFTSLTNGEILDYFKKKQLFRGIVFSENKGVSKSFSDVFVMNSVPKTLVETQNTSFESHYAFSKESCDISLITSKKGSLSLNTPYADAHAEFSQQKSKASHSEYTTEYLLSKLIISLMSFQIDVESCVPTVEFITRVNEVMKTKIEAERKVVLLMEVLDEFGFYIPMEFTMGGALYATETTEVKEISHAETEKSDFSAQANAKFCGYGGGMSFFSGDEESSGSSSSSKYKNIEVKQIGGVAGNTENKEFFEASLTTLENWAIVDIAKFYPTILLLTKANQFEGIDEMLFVKVQKLLTKYAMYDFVNNHQPYINIGEYMNKIKGYGTVY